MKRSVLLISILILSVAAASAATVRLHRTVEVTGVAVKLSDVAEVSNCPTELKADLLEVTLGQSPARSRTLRMTASEIRQRLFAAGINMAQVELEGSSVVEVRRGEAAGEPEQGREGALARTVRNAILGLAARQLSRDPDELDVSVLRFEAFGVPEDATVSLTTVRPVCIPSEATFQAVATVAEQEVGRFEVTAHLGGVRQVVVARRPLSPGTVIGEKDVELRSFDSAAVPDTVFGHPSLVVGERLAQRVRQGQPVTSAEIARPIEVHRGEVCTMIVRGRGFHVMTEARARQQGALGEEINMESLKTRKRFTAVVVGRRCVEVRPPVEEK
ncbi:MAG TPA: flagellar basal body P-ring formation chaperone FlgA [Planctomycetota bacterium]|nr:flagellar basal body P-ring formation chaperone FlgA [Planctomycetota bacterium]